jgi:hypothetical protein
MSVPVGTGNTEDLDPGPAGRHKTRFRSVTGIIRRAALRCSRRETGCPACRRPLQGTARRTRVVDRCRLRAGAWSGNGFARGERTLAHAGREGIETRRSGLHKRHGPDPRRTNLEPWAQQLPGDGRQAATARRKRYRLYAVRRQERRRRQLSLPQKALSLPDSWCLRVSPALQPPALRGSVRLKGRSCEQRAMR